MAEIVALDIWLIAHSGVQDVPKIEHIEGIGELWCQTRAAGITTTRAPLKACVTEGRRPARPGSMRASLKRANMADLMRIKGSGACLRTAEAAGVDTVKELRTRNAENLAAKMADSQRAEEIDW
ncbi:MAG: DUF4332 domain-containing protein [Geminicoccaceae bacterium]